VFLRQGRKDLGRLLSFLSREPDLNLFLISDLEAHGLDSPIVACWADPDPVGDFRAVLLRYRTNFLAYIPDARPVETVDLPGARAILAADDTWEFLSGTPHSVAGFLSIPPGFRKKTLQTFSRISSVDRFRPCHAGFPLRPLESRDAGAYLDLRSRIREFLVTIRLEEAADSLESGRWISVGLFAPDGSLLSSATLTAINRQAGMVVGVMTRPDARRRGYAGACVSWLCDRLLADGRHPCLFYDNPEAGSIYRRLGFDPFAEWRMLERGPAAPEDLGKT